MAGIIEKLYPPTISASIPAFYSEGGTVVITVPFSMNRAVSSDSFQSFSLKIKTAQSNTFLITLTSRPEEKTSQISNKIIKFYWPIDDNWKLKIGQYIKVQLAYNDENGPGYFSQVAVTKFTSKPEIYIENAVIEDNLSAIPSFKQSYIGVYKTTNDKSERPYAYNFYLYDKTKGLVEQSGWQLHNSNVNTSVSEALYPEKTTDTYKFETTLLHNQEYYIQYGVRTINNLEVFSPMYICIDAETLNPDLKILLNADNVFEEGYINLYFTLQDGFSINDKDFYKKTTDTELVNGKIYYIYTTEFIEVDTPDAEELDSYYEEDDTFLRPSLEHPISMEISRAEVGYGDTSDLSQYAWNTLKRVYFSSYKDMLNWGFKDFTIEQGVQYVYCFRLYNAQGVYSNRSPSGLIIEDGHQKIVPVMADFEDMFLWDGKRQLKIRFNPKVSSFKATRLEQKLDTIGSQYPFIFRNGVVNYKEFPIGGLISYLADNNEMFIHHEEDLNILLGAHSSRTDGTPTEKDDWNITQTLDSIGYNMRAERRFKMKLLEWLNNGEIKLFKSAAEGNFLVRLMNIQLTPEDKLGRMIHSFTANAYEVEELSYDNLINLGFITITDTEEEVIGQRSINIMDCIRAANNLVGNNIDSLTNITQGCKLNDYPIINYLRIEKAENNNNDVYVRFGIDDEENKTIINTQSLIFDNVGYDLPDVYFNPSDYDNHTYGALQTALENTILTYQYSNTEVRIGELLNIDNIYVVNNIESFFGPQTFSLDHQTALQKTELVNIYVLDIKRKETRDIYLHNGNYYTDNQFEDIINNFNQVFLYNIHPDVGDAALYYVDSSNNLQLVSNSQLDKDIIILINNEDETEYHSVPSLNLQNQYYTSIQLGASYYINCAYSQKITTYKQGG